MPRHGGATLCAAKPVFVDCDPHSYTIDAAKVEAAITNRTKAIVAVHLYGQPADMDPLIEIADKHGIALVEDCAHSDIAEYKGRKVGGLSTASSFSFYPSKNLGSYGEAGAAMTNAEELAGKFRTMRNQGASSKYSHIMPGHNYRMESIQGAVLGVKLKYLRQWTEARRKVAGLYNEILKDLDTITLPVEMPYAKAVYHLYVIRTNDNRRDALAEYLNEKDISTGLHYPIPLHLQPCFASLGYKKGDFPISENLAENCLSLPMYPELTEDQIGYVCGTIREFYRR